MITADKDRVLIKGKGMEIGTEMGLIVLSMLQSGVREELIDVFVETGKEEFRRKQEVQKQDG